tara:strand:+ start:607 stop:1128 length:522 start_codon:yes stop_codon:yes gene_type:complete
MKRFLLLAAFLVATPANADITSKFVTAASISVNMPYSQTTRGATVHQISGSNLTPSVTVGDSTTSGKIGGLNLGSLTNGVPALINTDTTVTVAGSAFQKQESILYGDSTPSAVAPSSGIASLPHLSGTTTVGSGGTLGSGVITSLSSGVHTCSGAFGSGSGCTASTTMSITID